MSYRLLSIIILALIVLCSVFAENCGDNLYNLYKHQLNQKQASILFNNYYRECPLSSIGFSETTCDATAQFVSSFLTLNLSEFGSINLARIEICKLISQNINKQNDWVSGVIMNNQIESQKLEMFKIIEDFILEPASHEVRFVRVCFSLYLGASTPLNSQSAHTFVIVRQSDSFWIWQSNQSEFDLWSWINQGQSSRTNPLSFPGLSPFAGLLSYSQMSDFANIMKSLFFTSDIKWASFAPSEQLNLTWALNNDITGSTNFKDSDIVGSVLLVTEGALSNKTCLQNLDFIRNLII